MGGSIMTEYQPRGHGVPTLLIEGAAFLALAGCVAAPQDYSPEKGTTPAATAPASVSPTPSLLETPAVIDETEEPSAPPDTTKEPAAAPTTKNGVFYRDPGTCRSGAETLPKALPKARLAKRTQVIHVGWNDRNPNSLVCEGARNMTAEQVLAKAVINGRWLMPTYMDMRPEYYTKQTALAYEVQRAADGSSLTLVRTSESKKTIAELTCTTAGSISYTHNLRGSEQTVIIPTTVCSDGSMSTAEIAEDTLEAGNLINGSGRLTRLLVSAGLSDAAQYSKDSYKPVQITFETTAK
jgi:hypothetical protein